MTSQNIPWHLDNRRGRQYKHTCPSCHKPQSFRRYVYTETNEEIGEECGKCDHDNSCRYHLPPKEFFKLHPEQRRDWRDSHPVSPNWANEGRHGFHQVSLSGSSSVSLSDSSSVPLTDVLVQQGGAVAGNVADEPAFTLDEQWLERCRSNDSVFAHWLLDDVAQRHGFSKEQVEAVLADYRLGATRDKRVIFWQIDHEGRVRSGKIMQYQPDGHRTGHPDWVHALLQRRHLLSAERWELRQCLFGEHLLLRYPDKSVGLVESEKTALVCSLFRPDSLWLATGGCGGLNAEKLTPLLDRSVTVHPDSGVFSKWYLAIKLTLPQLQANIVARYEKYEPNTDLADLLLRRLIIED